MHKVFVYGTLRSGQPNNFIITGCGAPGTLLSQGSIKGTMYDLGYFPGVRLDGHGRVHGELWEVTDACLERLDRLEGVATGFYARRQVPVSGGVYAWVYEINVEDCNGAEVVASGDWVNR